MNVLEDGSSFSSCSCTPHGPAVAADMAWQAAAGAAAQQPRRAQPATITGLSHHERRRLRHHLSPSKRAAASRLRHISRPAPALRSARFFRQTLVLVLLALLLCCGCASAAGTQTDRQRLRSLARRGEIVYDRSAPPPSQRMPLLLRRATGDDSSSSSALPTTLAPTRTSSASSAATSLVADTGSSSTAIPQPFDTSLGSNFTDAGCPSFFNSFLDNSTFIDCVPLSLLLQTSSSFFDATRSIVRTTQVLDASCSANFAQCSAIMDHFATELVKDSNCGADYKASNPTVLQAYKGLVAYAPVYQAGCQRDSSGSYCFANAITNSSSPTDSYPYYLPVGVALPGGSRPTCNSCLQTTMDAFWTFTSNKTQPISQTYAQAAGVVNIQCGPNFVNATVAASTSGGVATMASNPGLSTAALAVTLLAFFL